MPRRGPSGGANRLESKENPYTDLAPISHRYDTDVAPHLCTPTEAAASRVCAEPPRAGGLTKSERSLTI